mgnify:CR=1 FL=1
MASNTEEKNNPFKEHTTNYVIGHRDLDPVKKATSWNSITNPETENLLK